MGKCQSAWQNIQKEKLPLLVPLPPDELTFFTTVTAFPIGLQRSDYVWCKRYGSSLHPASSAHSDLTCKNAQRAKFIIFILGQLPYSWYPIVTRTQSNGLAIII